MIEEQLNNLHLNDLTEPAVNVDEFEEETLDERVEYLLQDPNCQDDKYMKTFLLALKNTDHSLPDEERLKIATANSLDGGIDKLFEGLCDDERTSFFYNENLKESVETELKDIVENFAFEASGFEYDKLYLEMFGTAIERFEEMCSLYHTEELAEIDIFENEALLKRIDKESKKGEYPKTKEFLKYLKEKKNI